VKNESDNSFISGNHHWRPVLETWLFVFRLKDPLDFRDSKLF